MSEKKNIDRLFQEKFKDFEANPPEFVWDNLEEILQEKKKKRRVVPLWWRVGGIAAALVVGMLFLYPFFTGVQDNNGSGKGVVLENPNTQKTGAAKPGAVLPQDGGLQPNRSVKSQGPSINNAVATAPDRVVNNQNPELQTPNQNPGTKFQNSTQKIQRPTKQENYANSGNGNGTNPKSGNRNQNNAKGAMPASRQYAETSFQKTNSQNGQTIDNSQTQVVQATGQDRNLQGAVNNTNPVPNVAEGPQQEVANQNNQDSGLPVQPVNPELSQPEQMVAETPADSILEPENELEKLQRKLQEEKEGVANNTNPGSTTKWNVKPQMGPLLYSSLSNGSPIDGQFAGNAKSFENQMSYGVGVNYAVSNKLRIRSGVNTVNLSYATQDIQFYASLNQGTNNVARTSNANIVVQNSANLPIVPTNSLANSDALPKETFNGRMVQSTGYIEVPVEMEYALLNKKFGINVIGGFSTLFLNDNIVSVVSNQGLSTNVGEAQNLNNVSFSTNLGIGFKYRFFKQFEASFEPTFKYQVNTYTRDSGNFRPYFVGLYTGISFSF